MWFRLESRDALEGNAEQSRVVSCQPSEHLCTDGDEVGGWVVGFRQLVNAVIEQFECDLGDRGYEPVLGTEEAVDRTGRRARFVGDGSHRERIGPTLGHQSLSCGTEPITRLLVVLFRSTHA